MKVRIKQLSIDDIVREKSDWMDKFDSIPYHAWLSRWHFLLRKLHHYSEIEREQNYNHQRVNNDLNNDR